MGRLRRFLFSCWNLCKSTKRDEEEPTMHVPFDNRSRLLVNFSKDDEDVKLETNEINRLKHNEAIELCNIERKLKEATLIKKKAFDEYQRWKEQCVILEHKFEKKLDHFQMLRDFEDDQSWSNGEQFNKSECARTMPPRRQRRISRRQIERNLGILS